jgi:hypothetical protein
MHSLTDGHKNGYTYTVSEPTIPQQTYRHEQSSSSQPRLQPSLAPDLYALAASMRSQYCSTGQSSVRNPVEAAQQAREYLTSSILVDFPTRGDGGRATESLLDTSHVGGGQTNVLQTGQNNNHSRLHDQNAHVHSSYTHSDASKNGVYTQRLESFMTPAEFSVAVYKLRGMVERCEGTPKGRTDTRDIGAMIRLMYQVCMYVCIYVCGFVVACVFRVPVRVPVYICMKKVCEGCALKALERLTPRPLGGQDTKLDRQIKNGQTDKKWTDR